MDLHSDDGEEQIHNRQKIKRKLASTPQIVSSDEEEPESKLSLTVVLFEQEMLEMIFNARNAGSFVPCAPIAPQIHTGKMNRFEKANKERRKKNNVCRKTLV